MSAATPAMDWDAAGAEAAGLLAQMMRIDTSNPPGNEHLACDWLEGVLAREGLRSERYDAGEGRHSLRVSYRGDGSKGPLMLLSHSDVVPCEPERWSVPPFAGEVRDGVLWGRGAIDDKGPAVMSLMTLLLFRRLGLKTARDLVFLCTADEETGASRGVAFLEREHPELFDVEYVINEGDLGIAGFMGMKRPLFGFSIGEKNPFWVKLSVDGPPGHGSVPLRDNCVERLIRAVERVAAWRRGYRLTPGTKTLLDVLTRNGVVPAGRNQKTLRRLAEENPWLGARLADGISVTGFHAGYKHNVIPGHAEATLDIRLLPGTEADAFLQALQDRIGDPGVRIEKVFVEESPASPPESELYEVLRQVVREHVPEAEFAPTICSGGTDSRFFRRRGIPAYGFIPIIATEAEVAAVHAHDERISLANIRLGTRVMFEAAYRMCVAG